MPQTVSIGNASFESIRRENCFYIDKTSFIREWWEKKDVATLIMRPRRFGKTLNMSMLNCFFSNRYQNQLELFEGLEIWKDETYRRLQGTYPVIFLSFASVKANSYENAKKQINAQICRVYEENRFLLDGELLSENEKEQFQSVKIDMDDALSTLNSIMIAGFFDTLTSLGIIMTSYLPNPLSLLEWISYSSESSAISPRTNP